MITTFFTKNSRAGMKLMTVVAGLALVLSAIAPAARAQTTAELQAQISALLAQISALQAQLGGGATVSTQFSRDLTIGATGADVTQLQNWLISQGYSIPAGATGYFGTQTRAAVAAYQAANAISPAAGYFGPITRAKVNASVVVTPPSTSTPDDDDRLRGGEASLERFDLRSGADSGIEEGQRGEIAEIEFRVEDGDVRINRIDLSFTADSGNSEDDPWKAFETIRILDEDGTQLAREKVSDKRKWLRDRSPFTFRFSGLDHVVREGDTARLIVEIEAQRGVVDTGATDTWTISVANDAVRAVDSERIQQYTGNSSDTVSFDIEERGANDKLSVRRSSDNPAASTLQVKDNSRSDWHTVLVFDLEAERSDIEIEELPVIIETDTASVNSVIDRAELVIDGKTFTKYALRNGNATTSTLVFDIDGDVVVDAEDRVDAELRLRFKAAGGSNYDVGERIRASVAGVDIEAEGADDLNGSGNVTGNWHTLQVSGIAARVLDDSAQTTSVDGANNDYATFTVRAELEAFEQDVFIPRTGNLAFDYQIMDSNGNVVETATATSSTVSATGASVVGDYYVIDEGDDATFTFRVVFDPAAADEGKSFRMRILSINYNDTAAAPDTSFAATPASHFETGYTYIAD